MNRIDFFRYGFLALPLAFAGLPLYIHAPDFYARDLGINIGVLGIILLAIRLFDAIQDPIIGYMSDRYTHKKIIFLTVSMFLLGAGLYALFSGPINGFPIEIWFVLSMIITTTGFSILTINLTMIGGLSSSDKNERTRLSSWREMFGLIGLVIAAIIPTVLSYYSLVYGFIGFGIIGLCLFVEYMRDNPLINSSPNNPSHFSFFKILFGHEKLFFIACFLNYIAAAIPVILVMFFIHDYLQLSQMSGLFLCLYFLSGAFFMPLWTGLSAKIGKYETWMMAMMLSVLTFGFAFFLNAGDAIVYGVICALSGIALGGNLPLPPSILADRITVQQNQVNAAQYYAVLSLLPKIAMAIASGIPLIILNDFSFNAGGDNSEQALSMLLLLYTIAPCIVKVVALVLLWFHKDFKGEQ